MNTLLHICCAPCSVAVVDSLRAEGLSPHGLWFNPNIQPVTEYRARRDTLTAYADAINLPLDLADEYNLADWLSALPLFAQSAERCVACYTPRLDRAAALATEHGFGSFTTTLLISPYQRHDLLREIGEAAAARHGIEFLYRDFRPLFRDGQRRARELGLYMQKYCGCVFSADEAFAQRKKP